MNKSISKKVAEVTPIEGKKGELQFSPIILNKDYAKKWNEHGVRSFYLLTIDEKLVSNSLYRKSGFGGNWKDGYMLTLKCVEDLYPKDLYSDRVMTISERRHLDARSCIINKEGKEMYVQDSGIDSVYLRGGVIYSVGDEYYNIETGQFYCRSYSQTLESDEFLFLDIARNYNEKFTTKGIMKICKKDGTYEVFSKS